MEKNSVMCIYYLFLNAMTNINVGLYKHRCLLKDSNNAGKYKKETEVTSSPTMQQLQALIYVVN